MEAEVGVSLGGVHVAVGVYNGSREALGVGEEDGLGDDAGAAGDGDFGEDTEAFAWGGFELYRGAGAWRVGKLLRKYSVGFGLPCACVFIVWRSVC